MKFKTAYNRAVQKFMTENKIENPKKLKYQLFNDFKDSLEKEGRTHEATDKPWVFRLGFNCMTKKTTRIL